MQPQAATQTRPTPRREFTRRRALFTTLVILSLLGTTALMVQTLAIGGFTRLDLVLTGLFVITLPWTLIGFWNAVIGFWLMRRYRDPATAVFPGLAPVASQEPLKGRTALLSCIRNEDVEQVERHLTAMIEELVEARVTDQFALFILSDSDWDEVITKENRLVKRLQERWGADLSIHYRRRLNNPGFKAGNIQDFCRRWGQGFDYMLVLDADSLMDAQTMMRMVRTLDQDPQLGILQSLIVGLPSASTFARPFQFGMRLGMKSYSLGSAWWQGDAGPYWGHNALIRIAPFVTHCHLPRLPGRGPLSGWVLSHDQVEAALMRRAGYAVRVMASEGGSWENNPTTLTEFIRRDLRWCQGNLQYLRLLGPRSPMPGLLLISRMQLLLAILMFIGSPAWVGLMLLGAWRITTEPGAVYDPVWGVPLMLLILGMIFAPKLASLFDALLRSQTRKRFGGAPRLLLGSLAETLFTTLIAPIMAIAHSLFIGGLVFGRAIVWGVQRRAVHWISPGTALRRLWPQTMIGLVAIAWLAWQGLGDLLLFSPFYIGALLAVPLAVISSLPSLGLATARLGLWRIPDETAPEPLLHRLRLDALDFVAPDFAATSDPAVPTQTPSIQARGQRGTHSRPAGRPLSTRAPALVEESP